MKFPITGYDVDGVEFTINSQAEYDALTPEQAREHGLEHHPAVLYERVEDTIVDELSGKKEITFHVTKGEGGTAERVPVGTLFNGREESHYDFSCVKPKA